MEKQILIDLLPSEKSHDKKLKEICLRNITKNLRYQLPEDNIEIEFRRGKIEISSSPDVIILIEPFLDKCWETIISTNI